MNLPLRARINRWFKNYKPSVRGIYAVSHGTYCGEFFVLMEEEDKCFNFLSLPSMVIRQILKDDFRRGIENAIVEPVEIIPKKYFNFLQKQYLVSKKKSFIVTQQLNTNEKSNNRHK